ncbi:MAG: precorrin-2 C(20)-methyltransferase [Desulfobulbaceae bacterium]|jgi:precorrin-2/cobalt-factor-2 C20-methyltransferase|nr:precorrin-2 C(20)-methyltransferase [Desulfobulbaceae bacterium]
MAGTLYVVGVGPGDPRLLTLRAAQVLRDCPVWLAPSAFARQSGKGENGGSTALTIAEGAVSSQGKTIIRQQFPMKPVRRGLSGRTGDSGKAVAPEVIAAWRQAADVVLAHLARGEDVAFPTLGDPAIYSTGLYLCETLREIDAAIAMEIIPGITAASSVAALALQPLCLGDERLLIIPAAFDDADIRELLRLNQVAVFMKAHKALPRLIALLDEFGLTEHAVLVERAGLDGQRIWTNIREAADAELHYFSTMIVRKPQSLGD